MLESLAVVVNYLPGILLLLVLSAFFSGSESAFFSLTLGQRRGLAKGRRGARFAHRLLSRPERLLMGILFWNLAINISYFSMVSSAALALDSQETNAGWAATITFLSLIVIIFFGEFLPKSVAVLYPLRIVALAAIPLSFAIRLLDGFLPVIQFVNEASRRLLWPGLKSENYLELADLERAIELSTDDSQLYEQERQVLKNVVQLTEIRVEEWMRPRTQYRSFAPPLDFAQLAGQKTASGYMLVTDTAGRDVVAAINLNSLLPRETENLAAKQQRLAVVPWCATIADALEQLRSGGRRVAVVVNEFGETIGILTWEDVFEAILQLDDSRSHRELAKADVYRDADGAWLATGMTKLRRLERLMGRRLNASRNLTVAGIVQEQLHRLPEQGDVCTLDDLRLEIVQTGLRGQILVRIYQPEHPPTGGES